MNSRVNKILVLGVGAAITSVLSGCNTAPVVPDTPAIIYKTKVVDTGCDWTRIIDIDKSEAKGGSHELTEETARQILAHNKARIARCGRAPKDND